MYIPAPPLQGRNLQLLAAGVVVPELAGAVSPWKMVTRAPFMYTKTTRMMI
jgi:hypothetical protein